MKKVVVVMPSGSRIEVHGDIEKVECLDKMDEAGEKWQVAVLPDRFMKWDSVGLSEFLGPDGKWVKAVDKPPLRPEDGTRDPRDKKASAS